MLLAGDVGGTKTNLAIFASKDGLHTPLYEAKLPSAQYPSLSSLVKDFLANVQVTHHDMIVSSQTALATQSRDPRDERSGGDHPHVQLSIDRAVFGVAGPVTAGQAKITNLPWVMREEELQKDLAIPLVHLINDLQAAAHAIPLLSLADLHPINQGKAIHQAPIAVVAPGTGLGEAFLIWNGTKYQPFPSEGGHADFAPTNHLETKLLLYMLKRSQHLSYEHVCSGIGLPNIYAYLKDSGTYPEPAWLAEQLNQVEDPTPTIISAALDSDPQKAAEICLNALKIFVSILGAEAGNMALKILATGGVYLAGGIPPRILPILAGPEFMHAFTNKGRFSSLLTDIPVQVILNTNVGLIGAAAYGFELPT